MSLRSSAGSPKKRSPPCCSRGQQRTLDGADGLLADVAVLGGERARVLGGPLQHRLQVLEVEQQQALLVGDLEDDVENALLRVVELQQAGHQDGTDLGHCGAHRMALVAEQVPVDCREGAADIAVDLELPGPFDRRGLSPPAWPTPDRSPFTSAMNTGTP
jgi:hypothetical protein